MKTLAASLLLVAVGGLAAQPGMAAEYKWTDQNGNIVYGDHPPAEGAIPLRRSGGGASTSAQPHPAEDPTLHFPLALRQAAQASPVALYVSNDCQPCQMAEQYLRQRGIPFQTWKVSSNADFARLKELGFSSNGFPAISIGSERSIGFEINAWHKMLEAAHYPDEPQLPATYRYPAISNLSPEVPIQGATSFNGPAKVLDASEVLPAGGQRLDPGSAPRDPGMAQDSFRF